MVVIVLIFVVVFGYFIWSKKQQNIITPIGQTAKIEEQKRIVLTKVRTLVSLPDEQPLFFTVSDSEVLKTKQDFFRNVENGDVLMVFEQSKLAILFRDKTNQIINIGPMGTSTSKTATTTKIK